MGDVTDEDRRFVRIYYASMIRDHADVWHDDAMLATWVRLLATADPMWPIQPEIPRSVKSRILTRLTGSSLVVELPDHRFQIKGFDKEREARHEAASNAAALRWQRSRTAQAMPTPVPVPVPAPIESPRTTEEDDGRADLEAFLVIKRRAPTPRQRKLLDDVMLRHDLTGPAWAADLMYRNPEDPIGAVLQADREWREDRIAQAQAAEKPKPKIRRKPGLPQSTRELLEEWQKGHKGDAA